MSDIAVLGLEVNSRGVTEANDNLKKFSTSAQQAENAAKGVATGATVAGTATQRMAAQIKSAQAVLLSMRTALVAVSTAMLAVGGVSLSMDIRGAREFSAAMAEVSTLLPTVGNELKGVEAAARAMAKEFGTSSTEQVRGFYQAISAGASTVAEATAVLDAANRMAIGGITDTVTAVDILTTATNAYAATGLTAAEASDALFLGMRAGKTTIGELASSLGQVVPLASSLGVSFDELVAGTAALTTQGVATSEAVTGLRAVLVAIAKPTTDAAKSAKALGINFTSAGLQAQGFAGFMQEVIEKTGGNVEQMAKLFGSVEALNAALSMAGGAGETFNDILDDMNAKAGATQTAYDLVAESIDKRFGNALARLGEVSVGIGNTMLTVLVPAMEALAFSAENAGQALAILTSLVAARFIPQLALMAASAITAAGSIGAVNIALGASLIAMRAATGAARLLAGALALVGGPVGLALMGVTAGIWYLYEANQSAARSVEEHRKAQEELARLMGDLDTATNGQAIATGELARAQLNAARAALEQAEANLELQRVIAQAEFSAVVGGDQTMAEPAGAARAMESIRAQREEIAGLERDIARIGERIEETGGRAATAGGEVADGVRTQAEAVRDLLLSYENATAIANLQLQTVGMESAERERLVAILNAEQEMVKQGIDLKSEEADAIRAAAGALADAEAAVRAAEDAEQKHQKAIEDKRKAMEAAKKSAVSYAKSQQDQIEMMRLEIRLVNASSQERNKAVAAMEAEQKIRDLGIDMYSREASAIRANAQELANLKNRYDQLADAAKGATLAMNSGGNKSAFGQMDGQTATVSSSLNSAQNQAANSIYGEGGFTNRTTVGGISLGPAQGARVSISSTARPNEQGFAQMDAMRMYMEGAVPPTIEALDNATDGLRSVVDDFASSLRDNIRDTERTLSRLMTMQPPRPDPYAERNADVFYDVNSDRHFVTEQQKQINVLETQLQEMRRADDRLRELIAISRENPALFASEMARFLGEFSTNDPGMSTALSGLQAGLGAFNTAAGTFATGVAAWESLARKFGRDPNDPALQALVSSMIEQNVQVTPFMEGQMALGNTFRYGQNLTSRFTGGMAGFADGGSFDVTGPAGVDRPHLVGLAGGERVHVVTPSQRRADEQDNAPVSNDNRSFTINVTLDRRDMGSDGRVDPELAGRNIARTAMKYMGRMG